MITAEVQVHGYRKGHQLLASSVILSKDDQAVVDRLSDVAGPLRPKEHFSPYLSAYPLPSGSRYVLARTWQDLTVARAGCVRTKSVLVETEAWSRKTPILSILRLLSSAELPTEEDAVRTNLEEQSEVRLPPAPEFGGSELLEALFLEDVKPVVVFDAPDPELIALRVLTALWPDMRRQFALSTFALSPRKISGRDLDLVFAPSSAKAKFSDWLGRRVDGRASQADRHRWTGTIVRRVFDEPVPRLLSAREITLLGDRNADSATVLRIALLWDELLGKLDRSPTAALGLLDIANSGLVSNAAALRSLEPRLAEAIGRAADSLPLKDAWDFVGAIARKTQGYDMAASRTAIEQLAAGLAERSPDGAISLLKQPDPDGAIVGLTPSVAIGLGKGAASRVEDVLAEAPADITARLVSQGGLLTRRIAQDDRLIGRMSRVLNDVDRELAGKAGLMLLPFLVEDRQLPAAIPIFQGLSSDAIAAELARLGDSGAFQAKSLCLALIDRAREVGGLTAVREILISSGASQQRNELLELTFDPTDADIRWILDEQRLSERLAAAVLTGVLRRADRKALMELFTDQEIAERVTARLSGDAADILARVALLDDVPINTYVRIVRLVLPTVDNAQKFQIALQATGRCLVNQFDGDEVAILSMLLGILDTSLDGAWVVRVGLERDNDADVANRNLVAFERAPSAARARIVEAVDEIGRVLQGRRTIDLTVEANDACARLMIDAEKTSYEALINAAGWLLPSLLRSRSQSVSLLIAALFPAVYRELAKADEVPSLLKLVPFYDWDRCKAARNELVDAFMSSSWSPGDLALTAYRCEDVARILMRVAKSFGGEEYLGRIERDLGHLNNDGKRAVKHAIAEIRSDESHKFY